MISGIPLILKRFVLICVFVVVRMIFRPLQTIWWNINGTEKRRVSAALPENYENCVQVLTVVTWCKFDLLQASTLNDFVYIHDRFESPRYIFDNDHVTLFMIDRQKAVFSESRDKDMHLWKSEFGSFIRESQVMYSGKLLVVPIGQFRRMAAARGDPVAEVVFLFNTGRCGSTLLGQMMEESGRVVSLSEPNQVTQLATLYRREGNTPEMKELAGAVLRWTCRPYGFEPLGHFIKVTPPSLIAFEMFKDVLPNARFLFMYRDVVKVAKSIHKMAREYPLLVLAHLLGRFFPTSIAVLANALGFHGPDFPVKVRDGLSTGVFIYIETAKLYLDLRRLGHDIRGVRYEDIISNPLFATRKILEHCGLPDSLAESCMKGLALDSQRNSVLSRANLQRHREPELTPDSKQYYDKLLADNGLPPTGTVHFLEGTITSEGR